MHVEDVIGRDRRGLRLRERLSGFVAAATKHEPEGRAQARGTVQLQEGKVVAPGEQGQPVGGDALLADGATKPVRERSEVVQRIHPG